MSNWSGYGPVPVPSVAGWDAFRNYVSQYFECDSCQEMFKQHITTVLSRTNFYNKRKYTKIQALCRGKLPMSPVLWVLGIKMLMRLG